MGYMWFILHDHLLRQRKYIYIMFLSGRYWGSIKMQNSLLFDFILKSNRAKPRTNLWVLSLTLSLYIYIYIYIYVFIYLQYCIIEKFVTWFKRKCLANDRRIFISAVYVLCRWIICGNQCRGCRLYVKLRIIWGKHAVLDEILRL